MKIRKSKLIICGEDGYFQFIGKLFILMAELQTEFCGGKKKIVSSGRRISFS